MPEPSVALDVSLGCFWCNAVKGCAAKDSETVMMHCRLNLFSMPATLRFCNAV